MLLYGTCSTQLQYDTVPRYVATYLTYPAMGHGLSLIGEKDP